MQGSYLTEVRDQYEAYPYPHREPADEKKRCIPTYLDYLDQLNHYGFGGKRDFRKDFRVLIAGGGTGDSAIFLAEQLRDTGAEIIYLDISTASMAIAKERAEVRALSNLQFVHGSLLDVGSLKLGMFDYINCSGVLHHLEKPEDGLKALTKVLKPEGVMGIMLYARYGRTGIYQLQELMRMINQGVKSLPERVANCRATLASMLKNPGVMALGITESVLPRLSDSDIYDLFLHTHDRAYTIPELYAFMSSAKLSIHQLFSPEDARGNLTYDPTVYAKNPALRNTLSTLSDVEQKAAAELMHGNIRKHVFYASRKPSIPADMNDTTMIPALSIALEGKLYAQLQDEAAKAADTITLKRGIKAVQFRKTSYTALLLKYMDGTRTIGEIYQAVLTETSDASNAEVLPRIAKDFEHMFRSLQLHNWIFLRSGNAAPYRTLDMIGR
ncbi:MAG: class I SAM-dependent methyltransferase [Proteobacteria bacterium]|nr:class I SAM-dependent methyltransferase [Pseudomonadota bacterium]